MSVMVENRVNDETVQLRTYHLRNAGMEQSIPGGTPGLGGGRAFWKKPVYVCGQEKVSSCPWIGSHPRRRREWQYPVRP